MTQDRPSPTQENQRTPPQVVEIGWILAGRLGEVERKTATQCRDAVKELLQSEFPAFDWQLPLVYREDIASGPREEPVALLEKAAAERNARHWDFSVLVTSADLISHYWPEANSAVSRSLAATVVSLSRLAGTPPDSPLDNQTYAATLFRRLRALVMHGLGHLSGLGHRAEATNFMSVAQSPDELDRLASFDGQQREQMLEELREVADLRLEEDRRYGALWPGVFYAVGIWINRKDIIKALFEAKPWQFPFRFSSLSTAAVAAALVLIVTAEVWELAERQSPLLISFMSLIAVLATTLYVLVRQRLFLPRQRRLNELAVMTNTSTFLVVLSGMATTYLLMVAIALGVGTAFFSPQLLHNWTGEATASVGMSDYIRLACFIASLSIFVGALGSSFERHHYFRHVIFVDEEM